MEFAVETWDPAYGTSSRDHDDQESARPVDAGVEVSVDAWQPITVTGTNAESRTVVFVDGVRRIDARIWITEADGLSVPGVCASVAAGSVVCEPGSANLGEVLVRRGLYTPSDTATDLVGPGDLGPAVHYEVRDVDGEGDEAVYLAVHNHMTEIEYELATALDHHDLVIFDGPLGRRDEPNSVGYVKTQRVQYLDGEPRSVIARLGEGQRTPLFRIGGQWPTWSWYLRLPGPRAHALSGIVRLELPGLGDASDAAERADTVTALLPRFASEAHKESRAPQNLYPISGLERRLRRRLGDPKLLERALRIQSRLAAAPA